MKISLCFYLGALFLYFISFISGFSIGLLMLYGVILLLLFGLASSLKLLHRKMILTSLAICVISYIVWQPLVQNVDDYYIFYPFMLFM